jgi:glycosyltransferase involved in cell wall biosynthesis
LQETGIDLMIWDLPRRSIYMLPLFIIDVLRIVFRLRGLMRERRIQVVHAQLSGHFPSALAALGTGIPVVWTIHSMTFLGIRRRSVRKWMNQQLYRFWGRRVAVIVAVSAEVRASVCNLLNLHSDRVLLVHNGTGSVDEPPAVGEVPSLRSELSLPETARLVVAVGGLRVQKGHTVLLDAVPEIVRCEPEVYFLLVGSGELESVLRQQVCTARLEYRVLFLGQRRDVNRILRECDVFVLPSLSEGLSLALLEAMRARKPIVATDVSGTREVILDGETGLLVPPGDAQGLAEAVLEVLRNPAEAQTMAHRARKRVETEFSAEAMTKRYLAVFQQVVSGE